MTHTSVLEVLNETRDVGPIVVLVWATHGPVDAGDGELYSLHSLVFVKVHIFEHEREDGFAVTIGGVELLDAVGGGEILVCDDRQDSLAAMKSTTYGIVPISTRVDIL